MSANIAFFTNPELASSKTRGEQIAERLGATVNVSMNRDAPSKHVVFVKTLPSDLPEIPESVTVWYDPIDTDTGLEIVAQNPRVNVIAIGDSAEKYLKARLRNRVVRIPEHHCNFDCNLSVKVKPYSQPWVTAPFGTLGFCGYPENLDLDVNTLGEALGKIGMSFVRFPVTKETTRQEIIDFYRQKIDVQLVFRLPRFVPGMPPEMKNPLKVINAASFGIPTVGYPELSYEEFPVLLKAFDIDGVVAACQRLKITAPWYRDDLIGRSSTYHIDQIVRLYKELFV